MPYSTYGIDTWYGAPRYIPNIVQVRKKSVKAVYSLPHNEHTNFLFQIKSYSYVSRPLQYICSHQYFYVELRVPLMWNHTSIIIIAPATEIMSYYHTSININLNPAFFINRLNNGILYQTT